MMEKLEKFYKKKFDDHEEAPMPDAFDRIMRGLEKDSMQEKGSNQGTIVSKPNSNLLKISLSLNGILLVAIPVIYYLLSNTLETTTNLSQTPQKTSVVNETQYVNSNDAGVEKKETNVALQEGSSKKDPISAKKQSKEESNYTSSVQEQPEQPVLTNTEQATTPSEVKTQEQNIPVLKEEVVTNSEPKKKKRNSDLYYEENASRLKDSTNLLFRKKK